MNLDKQFDFSVSLKSILAVAALLVIASAVWGALALHRSDALKAQKAEYRRRLRFMEAANKSFTAATSIMESDRMGDTAFGLAREKSILANSNLRTLAVTSVESQLAVVADSLLDVYSRCRGNYLSCRSELDSADLQYSKVFDELMNEAQKYDWRPADERADDDPLANDPAKK
jgi:hypothetical protein